MRDCQLSYKRTEVYRWNFIISSLRAARFVHIGQVLEKEIDRGKLELFQDLIQKGNAQSPEDAVAD